TTDAFGHLERIQLSLRRFSGRLLLNSPCPKELSTGAVRWAEDISSSQALLPLPSCSCPCRQRSQVRLKKQKHGRSPAPPTASPICRASGPTTWRHLCSDPSRSREKRSYRTKRSPR